MKNVLLIREPSTNEGTPGRLISDDLELRCIELPWKSNTPNRSCIPQGSYLCVPHVSPKFGRCIHVTGVSNRSHILFHAGNVAGDVDHGYRSHSHGCILVGLRAGRLLVNGRLQKAALASKSAVRCLLTWANNRPFQLQVGENA